MVAPVYAYDAAHVIDVDEAAFAMVKDTWVAVDPVWFASPAYVASAVAVPALVFARYETGTVVDRPPAPVTAAEHGVSGEPVKVTEDGHVTTVDDAAWFTVNVPATDEVVV